MTANPKKLSEEKAHIPCFDETTTEGKKTFDSSQ